MITSLPSSDGSGRSEGDRKNANPTRSALELAKRGFRLGVMSVLLVICGPIITSIAVPISGRVRMDSGDDLISFVCSTAIAIYVAALPTAAISGIVDSVKALFRLRKEQRRVAGFNRAAVGVVLNAAVLMILLGVCVLIADQLYWASQFHRSIPLQ